jgi:hypothetical protein
MISPGNGCDQYLSSFDGKPKYLWRGFGTKNFHGVVEKGPIRNRKPRDTPEWIHVIADQWFFDTFGARYRSEAMFCFGTKAAASFYGNIYLIVPTDEFTFCWSPKYIDLFSEITRANITVGDKEAVIKVLNSGSYINIDLASAIRSNSEIMVRSEKYLILAD